MKLEDLKGHRVVMFGAGREGQAVAEVVKRLLPDLEFVMTDDKPETMPRLEDAIAQSDANTIVIKSPGIPPSHPALLEFRERGVTFTTSTNLFFAERKGKGKLIGVTGTKGKSTTASLIAHVLKTAGMPVELVGNIGDAAINHVDAPDETIFVVELSSYHLMDLDVAPDIAVVTNLLEEHMDYHGSVEAYHEAKMRIVTLQSASDVLVADEEDSALQSWIKKSAVRHLSFAQATDALLDQLAIKGGHNRNNARAVVALARDLNVSDEVIAKAFQTFEPLPHRLQEIGPVNGILFVDDSISTIPEATLAAIDLYADRLGSIILGGQDRGYNFDAIAERLKPLNIKVFVMPGGDRLQEALAKAVVPFTPITELKEAVEASFKTRKHGQVCLLSPGSPSYGQFKNFEHRAEVFKQAIDSCASP